MTYFILLSHRDSSVFSLIFYVHYGCCFHFNLFDITSVALKEGDPFEFLTDSGVNRHQVVPGYSAYFIVSAFNHCGNHFEPVVCFDGIAAMRGDNDRTSGTQKFGDSINNNLGLTVNNLNERIIGRSSFLQFLTGIKRNSTYVSCSFLYDGFDHHGIWYIFNDLHYNQTFGFFEIRF
jgi:hypothetical protein